MHLLDWTMSVLDHTATPDRLQPLYGVTGERIVTEGEIGELSGYAGSRPVRVGNAAARQVQLDVFGPIAELLHELAIRDAPLTPEHWRIVEAMVGAVSARWEEPDHGIWELRARPRHHVHSRVMCWLTVDRGIRIAELLHGSTPEIWTQLRDAIAADVLEHGWDDRSEAFASAYGSDELDAASLWVGLGGLVDAGDPRFARTIEAIERELLEDGGVYRYLFEDGLPGREGTFHLCTCWLVQSLALVGRRADARALFDTLLGRASPLGLFSEEYDVRDGIALGNHPQAYSHAGVIECALALRDR